MFVSASCADKLDGFFGEVAYKGKFAYNHTVDISASESLLLVRLKSIISFVISFTESENFLQSL